MRLHKANFAGLTSPGQQSEMKSILAATWPPLKPLPVFKYETAEYRATIDFDKKRGEWVCRKTSLPSNEVQELRGGLAQITLALPHGEAETFIEGAEQQEPEFERETNRRLQAVCEWREKFANGARYFELQESLSPRQRTEMDDSLRLSLTARQLQFNSKNVADVFDDLSVAGGRFAALIELAHRKKAGIETEPQPQGELQGELPGERVAPEAECAIDAVYDDEQALGISSRDVEHVLDSADANSGEQNNDDAPAQQHEAAELCADSDDEFPALSIKDVFPEQELSPLAERMAHAAFRQFEIEPSELGDSEIVDADSGSLDSALPVEDRHPEERRSAAFAGFAAQARTGQLFGDRIEGADRIEGSSWRFPALQISAFHFNVFAILFLFAATSFIVGLTVGRGPLGKRLRQAPQSLLVADAKPPAVPERLPDQADESTPQTPVSPLASSEDSAGAKKLDEAAPPEEKPKENTAPSGESVEARSVNPNSLPIIESRPPAMEPKPIVKPEVHSEHGGGIRPTRPIVRTMLPRSKSRVADSRKAVGSMSSARRSHAPYRRSSAIAAAPQLPRPSTALVTVPSRGSQPFRVNFPTKTIAATSSLALTSQLSVLVPPKPASAVGRAHARLEAGELVSFVWPRYSAAGARYGLAETISVRATVGQLGEVQDVKFLSGSLSLLPATREAIRRWRYRPTVLDKRAVQAQQDVTIEFRPERYSSQLSAQHPPHN